MTRDDDEEVALLVEAELKESADSRERSDKHAIFKKEIYGVGTPPVSGTVINTVSDYNEDKCVTLRSSIKFCCYFVLDFSDFASLLLGAV